MARMLFHTVAAASLQVAGIRSRTRKIAVLADILRQAGPDEVEIAATYLGGSLRQRRTGVGWRSLRELPEPAAVPSLTVGDVDAALQRLADLSGAGSQALRVEGVRALFGSATAEEQAYLARLITGEVRQGALDGVLIEAVAVASGVHSALVRRAAMLAGSTTAIASAALTGGERALAALDVQVGRPVRPMLAASASDVGAAMSKLGGEPVAVEAKLDGIRIQVHKSAEGVRVFTRSLDDVTERLPGVVRAAGEIDATSVILDGEALALGTDGRPRPFQETAAAGASHAPVPEGELTPRFFDVLFLDGEPLIDRPLTERAELLAARAPVRFVIERTITDQPFVAEAFNQHLLSQGHEGVVVKSLSGTYAAGRRGGAWLKVKPVHTLDLVVLAVEWGSGRRRGMLSNIHLGARDGRGGWVMLGKTFKGMTDAMLAWQTERFLALETRRDDYTVYVRPEQVVEVAFDGLQRSTRYPGGWALRFARVVRYRDDMDAAAANTIADVAEIAALR